MVETRGQRLKRHTTLATFLCPDAGHFLPDVPPDCPFGHRRRRGRGRRGGTESADNLRSVPKGICLNHIKHGDCVNGTSVGCEHGLHPTLHELSDLDGYLIRANLPHPQNHQGHSVNVDTVTRSLAQLQLDSAPPGGPINQLPNELLAQILARLNMQELVLSGAMVCKRWRAVVSSIGHKKKSIYLSLWSDTEIYKDFEPHLVQRFFGQIDLSAYTHFSFRSGIRAQLAQYFPNVDSFVIDLPVNQFFTLLPQLPLTQVTTLSLSHLIAELTSPWRDEFETLLALINKFVSLKRLDLQVQSHEDPKLSMAPLAPTLGRLEHFTCGVGCMPDIVPNLSPRCTRLFLGAKLCYNYFKCETTLHNWHTINGKWLNKVTHLALLDVRQIDRIIDYLSTHASSLKVLSLQGNNYATMTSHMIGHLARLTHLTELDLFLIVFELPELYAACRNFRLAQLPQLHSCTMMIAELVKFPIFEQAKSSRRLATVLSTIMPHVEHLVLRVLYNKMDHPMSYDIVRGVESHLDSLPKLKDHSFEVYY